MHTVSPKNEIVAESVPASLIVGVLGLETNSNHFHVPRLSERNPINETKGEGLNTIIKVVSE